MSNDTAPNATIAKFGYPETRLAEYDSWVVLLRPQQVTLGALVLACTSTATAFSELDGAAFAGLKDVIRDIESVLAEAFQFEKLNYLMLMMVDPHVHFHVIPRYGTARTFAGVTFHDPGWPATPDLGAKTDLDQAQLSSLISFLRQRWPRERDTR